METAEKGGAARLRRYRKQRTRIDYFPNQMAIAVIEKFTVAGLDNCCHGVIDQLIVAGGRALNASVKTGTGG